LYIAKENIYGIRASVANFLDMYYSYSIYFLIYHIPNPPNGYRELFTATKKVRENYPAHAFTALE
jgi:hypothetical protein